MYMSWCDVGKNTEEPSWPPTRSAVMIFLSLRNGRTGLTGSSRWNSDYATRHHGPKLRKWQHGRSHYITFARRTLLIRVSVYSIGSDTVLAADDDIFSR